MKLKKFSKILENQKSYKAQKSLKHTTISLKHMVWIFFRVVLLWESQSCTLKQNSIEKIFKNSWKSKKLQSLKVAEKQTLNMIYITLYTNTRNSEFWLAQLERGTQGRTRGAFVHRSPLAGGGGSFNITSGDLWEKNLGFLIL